MDTIMGRLIDTTSFFTGITPILFSERSIIPLLSACLSRCGSCIKEYTAWHLAQMERNALQCFYSFTELLSSADNKNVIYEKRMFS